MCAYVLQKINKNISTQKQHVIKKTVQKCYTASSNYVDTIRFFEKDTGLSKISLEYYENPKLSEFIMSACKYNCSVDCMRIRLRSF